ncbi:hypothetical protein AVEN_245444-1, partial [Araneus ventricosus]
RVPDKTTVLKTLADNSEKQNLQSKHTGEMSGITFDKAKFSVCLRDNIINMLGKIEASVKSNTKKKVSVTKPTKHTTILSLKGIDRILPDMSDYKKLEAGKTGAALEEGKVRKIIKVEVKRRRWLSFRQEGGRDIKICGLKKNGKDCVRVKILPILSILTDEREQLDSIILLWLLLSHIS